MGYTISNRRKAGPQLDSEIAEKVMGLKKSKDGRWVIQRAGEGSVLSPNPPPYSSDKSAAMDVVNKIDENQESTFNYEFYHLYDGFDLKEIKPGQPIEEVRVDPLEICIAAIKAYEIAAKKSKAED